MFSMIPLTNAPSTAPQPQAGSASGAPPQQPIASATVAIENQAAAATHAAQTPTVTQSSSGAAAASSNIRHVAPIRPVKLNEMQGAGSGGVPRMQPFSQLDAIMHRAQTAPPFANVAPPPVPMGHAVHPQTVQLPGRSITAAGSAAAAPNQYPVVSSADFNNFVHYGSAGRGSPQRLWDLATAGLNTSASPYYEKMRKKMEGQQSINEFQQTTPALYELAQMRFTGKLAGHPPPVKTAVGASTFQAPNTAAQTGAAAASGAQQKDKK